MISGDVRVILPFKLISSDNFTKKSHEKSITKSVDKQKKKKKKHCQLQQFEKSEKDKWHPTVRFGEYLSGSGLSSSNSSSLGSGRFVTQEN